MKTKFSAILLAFVAVATLLTSCSKDETVQLPVVAFAKELYGLDFNNEAVVKVVSTAPFANNQSVDFTVSGGLVEGVDYTLSAKKFTFANGSNEATVVVKFLKSITEDTKLDLTLAPASFATLGLSKASVGVDISNTVIYSFDKENYTMTQSSDVVLQLSKISGAYTTEEALTFEVEVDPSSTAVEGEHFKFSNGKTITILAGQSKGTLKLDLIKQEAGKEQVVLKLKQVPFILKPGNFDKASVVIFGSLYDKLVGEWKYAAFTNEDWWKTMNNFGVDDLTKLAKGAATDKLVFNEEGLTTALTSDLKNYFRDSKLINLGEVAERLQEEAGYPSVQMLVVKALANVKFSATNVAEREAQIGFRVFTTNDGVETLEVTIFDFEPTDFLKNTYDIYKSFGDSPAMRFAPLRYHFTKVK
ncbi:DUF4843 domain-containing protein [Sphingobacterium sp. SGL-16]|uniref:DUF4843 domain-containing protein n=1 Tax=Sphingobacterium sp. SGL-16 TaxID=2710883 RepID=UPI0013ED64D2|nr:DUF4843 domain-containing protein [Sphingobacterium sp. SGL-16]NGM71918.1 DUF4843 domain-containing protein [Sphingobacterium sp. SGL-16]